MSVLSGVQATSTYADFAVFGTYGFLAVRRPEQLGAALRLVRRVSEDVDATCSRFRADSDLSRLNRSPGAWVEVDPLLVSALRAALAVAETTDGLVTPLLGRHLITLGYDRDFDRLVEVEQDPIQEPLPGDLAVDFDAWRDVEIRGSEVRIPPGHALDLGATAKAWASDLVATGLTDDLRAPAVISLGGDLAISAPDGDPWPVAVSHTRDHGGEVGSDAEVVWLDSGGLATSSTRIRRWRRHGVERHHVLDPRSGLPAREVWTTVTATGPTCLSANAASTASVVLGDHAPAWLDRHGVTARLIRPDGSIRTTGGWPAKGRS